MNHPIHRPALVIAIFSAALLLSCDVRKDATASEPGTWIMPRFADGTTVPQATSTVIGKLTAKGRPDTVRTVRYQSGGTIEFGTLPARTPFRLTLTGFDSSGTPLWWSYADDTTGSSPVKDVLMTLAPVPLAAGTLLPIASVWYKGDTLPVPAGALYTLDGSDPRTSKSALPVLVPAGLAVDSNDNVKVAVRVPADSATGRPELWSPVETFTFGIDVLDTITSLDTLFLSHWSSWKSLRESLPDSQTITPGRRNSGIYSGTYDPHLLVRVDTLPSDLFDGVATFLHVYLRLSSPRAKATCQGRSVPPDSFVEISLPMDSTVSVMVENHGRQRVYSIRLVKGWVSVEVKALQGLSASVEGLQPSGKSWLITLPEGTDTLSVVPSFPQSLRLRIGESLWKSGDTIPLTFPRDTTLAMWVVDSLLDPKPAGPYNLQILHAVETGSFRDTTWGVPWRDVAYDTLVDARNGRKYRTVVIGNARWMAENLNFRRDSSFCPANQADSCSKFGRLYRWAAAADTTARFDSAMMAIPDPWKGICPDGWHLPGIEEWRTLVEVLGSVKSGINLRSVGGSWTLEGGADSVGFRALPAGRRTINRGAQPFYIMDGLSTSASFWTATQSTLTSAEATSVRINGNTAGVAFVSATLKSDALSVRCVENTPAP